MNQIFENQTVSGDFKVTKDVEHLLLGLYLLNTYLTYVLEPETQSLVRVAWPYHSPIVIAPEVRVYDEMGGDDRVAHLKHVIDNMKINVRNHTSQRIFVANDEVAEHLGTEQQLEVISHQVWNQRVLLNVRVTAPCFARLAYALYPYLGVYVNGERVQPIRTAGDFLAVKLDAGVHEIELRPHLSPLRQFLLIVDGMILIGSCVWWWRRRRLRVLEGV
jgi:hypothetical protein